jgi:ribonuclease HI
MPKRKFYVVWTGLEPGVYDNWADCEGQIKGVQGARYKAFESQAEAEKAFREDWKKHLAPRSLSNGSKPAGHSTAVGRPISDSISVDAACSGNPGAMEYRGVYTADGTVLFSMGPYPLGTNNIGEFLAVVHALALLKKKGVPNMPIYSDSQTALGWVKKKKANTKLTVNNKSRELFDLIQRAESWLDQNTFSNPLIKWDTEHWGEIPADFGRK